MTITTIDNPSAQATRYFWVAMGLNFIWINLSEVFRYFLFVMPMMREAFYMVPDIAPMSFVVFLIWGIWDLILVAGVTVIAWLALDKYGLSLKSTLVTATAIWTTIFVILWLGMFNMNLATISVITVALPLAWLEMLVATLIVRWVKSRQLRTTLPT